MTSCEITALPPSSPRSWWQGACLLLCTVAMLLPFLDKPFNIDDPLFVWVGQHIQKTPRDFFGFDVNWNGVLQPMHEVTQNPPLASYYLAAAATLSGGWNERWLHAAGLLPAIGVVWGTWVLAAKMSRRPLLAGLAVVCSPVFLVSSTNVMCDVLMTCLWMAAIILWRAGLERNSHWRLALAALLIGAAALTKYFGLCLLPLLVLYTLIRERRLDARLLWLLIPVACLAGYEAWTRHLYGHGLVTGASQFVRERYLGKSAAPLAKWIATLTFTGGCLICLPFFLPRLFRQQRWKWLMALGTLAGLTVVLSVTNPIWLQPNKSRPTTWDLAFQAALLVSLGCGVLLLMTNDLRGAWQESREVTSDNRQRVQADAILLASWIIGTMLFAGWINWTVNGRSVLPLVPAVAILLCRALDRVPLAPTAAISVLAGFSAFRANLSRSLWLQPNSAWPVLLLLPSALLSLLIAHADYRFAQTQREAAEKIMSVGRPARTLLWFAGHWGFQYYMQQFRGIALEYPADPLEPGDMLAMPTNNDIQYALPAHSELVNKFKLELSPWASTNLPVRCAGFYNSEGGILPFVFGPELQPDPKYTEAIRENRYDVYTLTRIRERVTLLPKWVDRVGEK